MQILVDADACPVNEIIVRIARQKNIPVTLFTDTSRSLGDGYSTVVTVGKAKDAVDISLINTAKKGDIVVTQDYGVAAMALGKGVNALNQNGLKYSRENMDRLLFERHISQKVRRGGGRLKGPPKRTREDDARFTAALLDILKATE